ncbi:MAG: zinc-ribbon domain-containing protein [Candidatus Adiutrix sp.]|jgi:uncharacterized paraquat-inducible protein A|nr:zinc-ribbon domain-containing protein [Candidatus Adiutrix sp.]
MKIKTRCAHCGKIYHMDSENLGKTAQCKQCQNTFVMSAYEEPASLEPLAQQPAPADPAYTVPPPPPLPFQTVPADPPAASPPNRAQPASDTIQIQTQTIVCPKCKYTAEIPPVTSKLSLRCPECGHKFTVQPNPKSKTGVKTKPAEGPKKAHSQTILLLFIFILIVAGLLVAGPKFLPEFIPDLLPPDIRNLLPF